MFERRLKIFLLILVAATCVLVLRAAHVQVVQKEQWQAKATEAMKRSRLVETVRGRILDHRGRVIAVDEPCIDACIDFRALTKPADERWVRDAAVERLRARMRDGFGATARAKRTELINAECDRVRADIDGMWARLAGVAGRKPEAVEEVRDEIVKKVTMRRRYVWYRNYELAMRRFEQREPAPKWRSWLIDETSEMPTPDQFTNLTVEEERVAHPILKAITPEMQNELRKHIERYPGLVLRPGVQRKYPYADAGCHLLGQLSRVTREDLAADPHVGTDELRQYQPNDLIGRTGLEKLAEPLLRGARGKIETVEGRDGEVGRTEAVHGSDVRTTLDIELQSDLANMFRYAKVVNELESTPQQTKYDNVPMHGGAVVIDVATGEVRAMASYPTFDLNTYQEKYAELAADELETPLLNRATQAALVPGSTVKPVVGLAGIAEGVVGVHQGIECNGFLVINGRQFPNGRCWTQSMFGQYASAHHQIPYKDPHVGTHGNATGFLTYSDAIQRSCNVYFENVGDRLKMEGLAKWYLQFGLGRPTGVGLPEVSGSLPTSYRGPEHERRFATWIASIGQGTTTATPVQMANVAATIARGGVWVRPRLVGDGARLPRPANPDFGPDRVDLPLPPGAIAAAKDGMIRVVNTEAGSGKALHRKDILIAGKTGTAELGTLRPLRVKVRDERGDVVYEESPADETDKETGQPIRKPKYRYVQPSSPHHPNPEAPWYRGFGKEPGREGTVGKHSWFIGFAPADNPKVAFAVMVEYGGSGGHAAGLIAKELIANLIERQYLPRDAAALPAGYVEPAELLHDDAVGD